ncbi:hypothetical protein G7Y79_00028g061520 [Physcia stellaris]|nr:hypothetical protein G7Y79_00028g061520 [Physcia stellaris]
MFSRRHAYRTTFEPERTIQPIYTGGDVALDDTGRILATCLGEDVAITDLDTGRLLARIEGDGEVVTSLAITSSASHLIVCSRSVSMRIYQLSFVEGSVASLDHVLLRTLKPHSTPVISIVVDRTGTLVATGGADGTVKVWDIRGGYVTHTFRGHTGVISALHFFECSTPDNQKQPSAGISRKRGQSRHRWSNGEGHETEPFLTGGDHIDLTFYLASGGEDGKVKIWSLAKRHTIATLDSHVSIVRGICCSNDLKILNWKLIKVIPVLEAVESVGFLDHDDVIYTGGENGNLRIWDHRGGRELTQEKDGERGSYGTHDEIIDMAYTTQDRSLLALATNSEAVRLISLSTGSGDRVASGSAVYFGADVGSLQGHEDIIICLDVDWSGCWLATGAKDDTARLWSIDHSNGIYKCVATFTGHAESLGAISLPQTRPPAESAAYKQPLLHPPSFLLSGSQDKTIKRWSISRTLASDSKSSSLARAVYTRKAHDKDINAISINHSSTIFASASQDRTAKIWSVEEGEVQGVLRGHRRGIWSVQFAPKNTPTITGDAGPVSGSRGLVLTGSGDKTVKIWSLTDYSCLRTFEGHTNSVLKVLWLPTLDHSDASNTASKRPLQIASAGGDGLVKVWDANSGEAVCTLDNHIDRVWALTVNPETGMLVSGGGDSVVTFWKDTTSSTIAATTAASTYRVEQEQQLQNYIHHGSYREAIVLALELDHPARLLKLLQDVTATSPPGDGSLSGVKAVDEVLGDLSDGQLLILMQRLRDWNTNARTAVVAQRILGVIVRSYPMEKLAGLRGKGWKEILAALKVYTERHYRRVEELVDESYLVEYTLAEMEEVMRHDAGGRYTQTNGERDVIMS